MMIDNSANVQQNNTGVLHKSPGSLSDTEMIIVRAAISMLNQIGLSGADADFIVWSE